MKVARSRKKSYADNRRRDLEFFIDDWVFSKTSPMKGTIRSGQKSKLSLRYIGPFKIKDQKQDWRCGLSSGASIETLQYPQCISCVNALKVCDEFFTYHQLWWDSSPAKHHICWEANQNYWYQGASSSYKEDLMGQCPLGSSRTHWGYMRT